MHQENQCTQHGRKQTSLGLCWPSKVQGIFRLYYSYWQYTDLFIFRFVSLLCLRSTLHIFQSLVEAPHAPLQYLLTYKLSQDHLELFFGAVRSSGGFNNNPTAQQFTAAYKCLLMRTSIEGTNGNCQKRDPIEILHVIGNTCSINDQDLSITNAAIIRKYDLEERCPVQSDHDYTDALNVACLSEFKQAAISFMAGYVPKMVRKQLLRDVCSISLGSTATAKTPQSAFMVLKDKGGLLNHRQVL